MTLISLAVGLLLGFALGRYRPLEDRCEYLFGPDRCHYYEGHHGPHRVGTWPDREWRPR